MLAAFQKKSLSMYAYNSVILFCSIIFLIEQNKITEWVASINVSNLTRSEHETKLQSKIENWCFPSFSLLNFLNLIFQEKVSEIWVCNVLY